MRNAFMLLFVIASGGWTAGAQTNQPIAPAKAPIIESGFVGCPEFETKSGKFSAGTAFFAKLPDETRPLLITVQHIFGPAGGLKTDVPKEQMAGFANRVTLRDLVRGMSCTTKIDSLATMGTIDIAAFRIAPGTKVKAHPFAKENPQKGDVIWLVASLDGQPKKEILHRGTVVEVGPDQIRCKFDNGNLVTRGASGAPYINAMGEVVGVHTGSFKDPGNVAGAALAVEAIMSAISAASTDTTPKALKK